VSHNREFWNCLRFKWAIVVWTGATLVLRAPPTVAQPDSGLVCGEVPRLSFNPGILPRGLVGSGQTKIFEFVITYTDISQKTCQVFLQESSNGLIPNGVCVNGFGKATAYSVPYSLSPSPSPSVNPDGGEASLNTAVLKLGNACPAPQHASFTYDLILETVTADGVVVTGVVDSITITY
jgi:hypothetical protein